MEPFPVIDLDLLRRYDEPGPRYTSYPTAPLFNESFDHDAFAGEIAASNPEGAERPLSLYVHLPFCDELCYFCACTMIVTRKEDKKQKYLDYLARELDMVASRIAPGRSVEQLHWGGGTPTDHTPEQILELAEGLRSRFAFAEEGEFSCEIDPRGLDRAHVAALRAGGFNRVSMGVQDFAPDVQTAVNRIQPEAMTREVIAWCRDEGFQSVNLDFIYGLPHQTLAGFEKTVDTIIDIAPDRIALFNFAYVPWLKKHHEQLIDPAALPSPEVRLQLLKMSIEKLIGAGYVYIGMDHFARPDDELAVAQRQRSLHRNFQGYSTRAGCDLYAFGMSAISQLERAYAQNHKTLDDYYGAIDAGRIPTRAGYRLHRDDEIRRDAITQLMCHFELRREEMESRWAIDMNDYFAESLSRLDRFVDDGLVARDRDRVTVTPIGRLVIRNIAMCFDRYLDDMRGGRPVFSRTV